MKVFVTGASGWIGSAAVPELLAAGHEVTGLARSEQAAAAVAATGAEVRRGGLDDLAGLRDAAAGSDAVLHLAFRHDIAFSGGYGEAADSDRAAIDALGEALAGSDRPLVVASGLAGLAPGRVATERDVPDLEHPMGARGRNEAAALALAGAGVRSVSVRFAPTVHGDGDTGFLPRVIAAARAAGTSGYLGDGTNRWAAVHRADAAVLLRLALEGAPAGAVLHAAGEEGVALRDVADVIGRHLDLPVVAVAADDAAAQFGFLAGLLGADIMASSAITRELLGWAPTHPGLLADLDAGHYFG